MKDSYKTSTIIILELTLSLVQSKKGNKEFFLV